MTSSADHEYLKGWQEEQPKAADNALFSLGSSLQSEFNEAELLRKETELRWLTDLRQYRGQYEPEEEAAMTGSRAFARKTRVKVESVDARMMDMLFPASHERNFDVKPTPEPSVPTAKKRELTHLLAQSFGRPPSPEDVQEAINQFVESAAAKMATRISDQLAETKYRKISQDVMHSGHVYGTGILKGPLVERKIKTSYKWDSKDYKQIAKAYTVPFVAHVPIWRWYPDMTVTELGDCRYTWEHHRLSRSTLFEMSERRSFDRQVILDYIAANPDGAIKLMAYEQDLRAIGNQQRILSTTKTGQYDVYERWGWLTAEQLAACGICVPCERMQESFYSNVWMLPDGTVIKAVLSPLDGMSSPYHLYYLDKDETSIFGDGYPAIMRDDQSQINAARRMILDNAAVCAGPQFEAFVPAFPVGTDFTNIHPLKIWPRSGGDFQYPAIRAMNFDSHISELQGIEQMFDQSADETTAVPKFTYGDNPQSGAAGTMGGLSMLLGQANIALKGNVINWDEGITRPFITDLYRWNMQFSRDASIKGDYDVQATGAASLVAKEVRGNMLIQFGSSLPPEARPFIKWDEYARQVADVQELSEICKSKDEMEEEQNSDAGKAHAEMMQMQQQLAMQSMQLEVAKLQATVEQLNAQTAKLAAEAQREAAETVDAKVKAAFSAMQAGGVIATNSNIAPIGDALLKEAGWVGATQEAALAQQEQQVVQQQMAQEQQAMQEQVPPDVPELQDIDPELPDSPQVGAEGGIETGEIEGLQ
jgi:hypothetical protein